MVSSSAVMLLLRSPAAPSELPLMLQKVQFSPLARELSLSLERLGVERFFVISEDDLIAESAACFPEGAEVVSALDSALDQRLMAFARSCQGKILTVTAPVWMSADAMSELVGDEFINPAGDAMGVYRVEADILAQGGVETLNYGEFYSPLNEPEVDLLVLRSRADLRKARQLAREDNLYRMLAAGVDVLDPAAAYVEGGAEVGPGTRLLPGTILRGRVRIGANCEIGPNSMLTDCVVEDDCTVNASQLREVLLPAGSSVGPFAALLPEHDRV